MIEYQYYSDEEHPRSELHVKSSEDDDRLESVFQQLEKRHELFWATTKIMGSHDYGQNP